MRKELVRVSKFLSLVLRHDPGRIGLELDEAGWASVDELLARAAKSGRRLSLEILDEVVATNEKRRFEFDSDRTRIRARQGHSIDIDLGLSPCEPPAQLFHGTATRFLSSIRDQGLVPGSRQHVHLSADTATAQQVGQRHGKPVVLTVESLRLHAAGQAFYLSTNGVWLTEQVPPDEISFPD